MEAFRQHLRATDRSGSEPTYMGAARVFAEWIAGKYGDFDPAAVSPLDLVEYRNHLQTRKSRRGKSMAPATVNKILISLRMFFEWLRESGQVRDNPVAGVKQVALATRPAPKWLTRKEQAVLVHVVQKNPRDMAIIGIMLHAGLRVNEVCALDREDIDISERKGLVRVREGKGNKFREIPLNKTIRKNPNGLA